MFEIGEPLRLSDIMPMLSNFGITVISEEADESRIDSGGAAVRAFVQSFRVQDGHGAALESTSGAAMLPEALTAVRRGQTEDGPLNALVLEAGLGWREIALLRTYVAAAFQMRLAPAFRRSAVCCWSTPSSHGCWSRCSGSDGSDGRRR